MEFVYLAHPIDLASHNSWLGSMVIDLKVLLAGAGIGAFNPGSAYLANLDRTGHARYIQNMNNIAIHQADGFIAVLPRDVPTLGTPVEIEFALSMRKPTVIFTDIERSVQLAAWERAGAVIADMGADAFVWPEPAILENWFITSRLSQEEKPCLPTAVPTVSMQPLLVEDNEKVSAANLRPGQYSGDAGIDLATSDTETLAAGEFRYLSTGVHVAIPDGFFGWITGRSSTWRDYRCSVVTGVIDSGYRGELMIGLRNEGKEARSWPAGTRLGQLILLPVFAGQIQSVDELPEHERGLNGYGSSGA